MSPHEHAYASAAAAASFKSPFRKGSADELDRERGFAAFTIFQIILDGFAARLKPCPDTKHSCADDPVECADSQVSRTRSGAPGTQLSANKPL
jgi:hypothetical protein